jgi:hypothetical protein
MNNREINETRTKLLMKLAEAGRAALEFDPLAASALAAIPDTNPQQYVATGTLWMIAKLLPSVDAAPAVQAPAVLTDKRIDAIAKPYAGMGGVEDYRSFARSIERELRAGSSDVRDKAQWISMSERRPEDTQLVLVFCPDPEPGMWPAQWMADSQTFESRENGWAAMNEVTYWMPLPALPAAAPAASKEGDAS